MGNKLIFMYRNNNLIYKNKKFYWVIYNENRTKKLSSTHISVNIETVKFKIPNYPDKITLIHMCKDNKNNIYPLYPLNPTLNTKYKKYTLSFGIFKKYFYVLNHI